MENFHENPQPLNILLVDDEEVIHEGLTPYLRDIGHSVDDAYRGASALEKLDEKEYDLIISDIRMPQMDGITLLGNIVERQPDTAVVLMTAYGEVEDVIRALRLGAADFLTKPVKLEEIDAVIEKAVRLRELKKIANRFRETLREVQSSAYQWRTDQRLIGESPDIEEVRKMIRSAVEARCDTVLIQGETGTGKEVVAREIHLLGKKENSPFIAISCPALPENLVESELFGHVKGAFTGADSDKAGCFETADGGTLFLDEVADLSAAAQAKLLRVLETRSVRRVGGKKEINTNVNVVAATNSPLSELVAQKQFREDLFYRLNVFAVNILPLRERREDIVPLAEHFLDTFAKNKKMNVKGFSEKAKEKLYNYDFPGNARELRNIIERAAILCREGLINPEHLSLSTGPTVAAPTDAAQQAPAEDNDSKEKNEIIQALEETRWNRTRAAQKLGVPYSTLRYRMKKYDIST